jgi:hypothetical protein
MEILVQMVRRYIRDGSLFRDNSTGRLVAVWPSVEITVRIGARDPDGTGAARPLRTDNGSIDVTSGPR